MPATESTAPPNQSLLRGARQLGTLNAGATVIAVEEAVLEAILEFSEQDLSCERGGFLLGSVYSGDVPLPASAPQIVLVRHFHPALEAKGNLASLTFTHEAWAALARHVQQTFPDQSLVGWHHTHPGLGVFLSVHDRFIHRHFFAQPWQIALVVDPRRQDFGFFQWCGDELRACGFLCLAALQ
jgi:proteasome lid subunit RPN8/RPN11